MWIDMHPSRKHGWYFESTFNWVWYNWKNVYTHKTLIHMYMHISIYFYIYLHTFVCQKDLCKTTINITTWMFKNNYGKKKTFWVFVFFIISGITVKKKYNPFQEPGNFWLHGIFAKRKERSWEKYMKQTKRTSWRVSLAFLNIHSNLQSWLWLMKSKQTEKDFCRILFPVLSVVDPDLKPSADPISYGKRPGAQHLYPPLCTANVIWITYCLLCRLFGSFFPKTYNLVNNVLATKKSDID